MLQMCDTDLGTKLFEINGGTVGSERVPEGSDVSGAFTEVYVNNVEEMTVINDLTELGGENADDEDLTELRGENGDNEDPLGGDFDQVFIKQELDVEDFVEEELFSNEEMNSSEPIYGKIGDVRIVENPEEQEEVEQQNYVEECNTNDVNVTTSSKGTIGNTDESDVNVTTSSKGTIGNTDEMHPLTEEENEHLMVNLAPKLQASSELVSKMKNEFYANLFSKDWKYNSVLMTKRKYDSIIEDVKRIKVSRKKESSRDYRIIDRYDVLTVEGCEKLIEPLSDARESVKKFVHAEELFDILYSTHLSVGHGGRDKMIKQLNTLYKNITQAQIRLFLDLCEPCQQKLKRRKNSRCQVDLID